MEIGAEAICETLREAVRKISSASRDAGSCAFQTLSCTCACSDHPRPDRSRSGCGAKRPVSDPDESPGRIPDAHQ